MFIFKKKIRVTQAELIFISLRIRVIETRMYLKNVCTVSSFHFIGKILAVIILLIREFFKDCLNFNTDSLKKKKRFVIVVRFSNYV